MKIMTRQASAIVLLLVALAMVGCAPSIRVSTDYDPSAQFPALKKYGWLKQDSIKAQDPRIDNSLMRERIERAVDAQLSVQGFEKVDSESAADFMVAYHVFSENKVDVRTTPSHLYGGVWGGYYPCWYCSGMGYSYGYGYQTDVIQYKDGEFIIDFLAPQTHKLLWRGSGQRRLVSQATPVERETFIKEVIEAILLAFPPGAK